MTIRTRRMNSTKSTQISSDQGQIGSNRIRSDRIGWDQISSDLVSSALHRISPLEQFLIQVGDAFESVGSSLNRRCFVGLRERQFVKTSSKRFPNLLKIRPVRIEINCAPAFIQMIFDLQIVGNEFAAMLAAQ